MNQTSKHIILALAISLPLSGFARKEKLPVYKNPAFTSSVRAADLLSRMSVEEKTAQLMAVWDSNNMSYTQTAGMDSAKMRKTFGLGVHSVQPTFKNIKETVAERNMIQRFLLEKTRLGIPALFVDEGQHGMMRPEATVFPQAIGLACSWNPQLIGEVYDVVAREMRSRGTTHVLSPVIDVCREPRWGRVEETYGEDPFLNSRIAVAAVRGLQGSANGQIDGNHVGATLKHFCGHGQPEGGINQAPASISIRSLREFHFPPFQAAIREACPASVMPSYNEIDGVPSHANSWLLNDVLRREFGFRGMIVSDYSGISQLFDKHFVAADAAQTAALSFNSGVQSEFPSPQYFKVLPQLIREGRVSQALFDSAVYQVLKYKFDLGLFDNPYTDLKKATAVSLLPSSSALALKAAQQSIVLLKNDGLLPLSKTTPRKIAVIGPGADVPLYGGYAGEPYRHTTLLQGIRAKVAGGVEVLFAQGCRLTNNASIPQNNWKEGRIDITPRAENLKLIDQAVAVAKTADVIILAIGENEQICREAWHYTHIGDNMTLDLFGQQQELADALLALGKPLVVYLQNGRPLSINALNQKANAIVEGWYMGQESGAAAADILFGDVNPSGKLTITFPKSAGQLPLFYNHKPGAQYHNYISQDIKPLYPFGFGLSYTTFAYSAVRLSKPEISRTDTTWLSVDVTNTGQRAGDEIVQLYIRDEVSSVTRPVKELKGFQRITLAPGQTKTVTFPVEASLLAFWDINMRYTVEPGIFKLTVGTSSDQGSDIKLTVH